MTEVTQGNRHYRRSQAVWERNAPKREKAIRIQNKLEDDRLRKVARIQKQHDAAHARALARK